jgi:hypothetical protein
MAEYSDPKKLLARFQKCWSSSDQKHREHREFYKKCDDGYNAIIKPSEVEWQSDLHPPYALQIIDVIESNIVDDEPDVRVLPAQPQYAEGADLLTHILKQQRYKDGFAEKYALFVKQALIRGISVAKVPWLEEWRRVPTPNYKPDPLGQRKPYQTVPYRQQPGFVNVDANHFLWDCNATSLDDAEYVFFRTYETKRSLEAAGVYENLDKIEESNFNMEDDKERRGRVEVIEWWWRDGGTMRLTVIANREVVIRDCASPFWHGQFPFAVANIMPTPFAFRGKSIVEIINDIQIALWELQNQRIDNSKFMANAAMFVDPNTEQQDLRLYPGAVIPLRPDQVQAWVPNISILQPSVQAEELLKGDLQNITGAVGYLSGASNTQIDQTTATGISVISNMAAKRIIRMKQQIMFAMRRVGEQQIALNQQLLPGPVAVRIDANAEEDWRMVTPADIQGQYDFRVEDANESLMRQERRAEALAFANWFGQNYMLLTQSGVTPNMRRVAEDVIQAFDEDPKEYLGEEAAMQAQPNPLVGGMGAAPPGPTTPNGATGVPQAGPVDFSNLATILGAGPGEPSL